MEVVGGYMVSWPTYTDANFHPHSFNIVPGWLWWPRWGGTWQKSLGPDCYDPIYWGLLLGLIRVGSSSTLGRSLNKTTQLFVDDDPRILHLCESLQALIPNSTGIVTHDRRDTNQNQPVFYGMGTQCIFGVSFGVIISSWRSNVSWKIFAEHTSIHGSVKHGKDLQSWVWCRNIKPEVPFQLGSSIGFMHQSYLEQLVPWSLLGVVSKGGI